MVLSVIHFVVSSAFIILSSADDHLIHSIFSLSPLRSALCQALVTAASKQDESPSLLTTLASSLLASFSSSDVISIGGRVICSTALLTVTSLARKGYLVGSTDNAQLLAELISAYTVANAVKGSYTGLSMYNVSTAASWLVEGVQLGMASGELPIALVTPSIQVVVVSELITTSSGLVLSTPPTAAQTAYGSIQPKITLGPNGLSACPFSGGYGYAQLSALQWSVNPYPGSGSMAVVSPLLRLTSSTEAATAIVTVSMQSSGSGLVKSQVQQDHVTISLPGVPAYYITLQFSSKQAFNFSAATSANTTLMRGPSNYTLPACSQYNGAAYVHCKGCNISSYSNINARHRAGK